MNAHSRSRRLTLAARRDQLVASGARLFATLPYGDVLMEEIARDAGVSRALLYRHFPSKRDLFAAVYQRAADQLLLATPLDRGTALATQVAAGLDEHIAFFVANRHAVLAANTELAGDPVIQAIIVDELAVLRQRLLDAMGLVGRRRELASAVLMSWLVFVRVLCVDWLANPTCTATELRDICCGALLGALAPLHLPAPFQTPAPARRDRSAHATDGSPET